MKKGAWIVLAACWVGLLPSVRGGEVVSKDIRERLKWVDPEALREAMEDMRRLPGFDYEQALEHWNCISRNLDDVRGRIDGPDSIAALEAAEELLARQRAIVLANPLLDMDKIVVTRFELGKKARKAMAPAMCTPLANYAGLMDIPRVGYRAEICELSNLRGDIRKRTIYKPELDAGIADVQLHWNADRLIFASSDTSYKWQIFEVGTDGGGLKRITRVPEPELEFADPCYLPDGRIWLTTNIGYNGIPCENGTRAIHNMAVYDPATDRLRKISFDQDGNWCPTVLNNGRIMYTRWEYTDLTHYFSRIVMHANPDGTETKALYGSGSFWPNSIFDMKQLPSGSSRFIGVVSGHHGVARSGRLMIFDPAKSRKEEKGVVQELPYRGRPVVPEIKDYLVDGVWPQFCRPFPLNDNYFLVTAKLSKESLWGVYLVDVFNNLTLIAESEGDGYITPIPLVKRPVPPVIPDRVDLDDKEATVFIQDIYEGEGLRGVPRGVVKKLRVFTYEYAYLNSPSDFDAQGIQSGWDIKRELGTVEVEKDGSAIFKVPANTPVSLQPLDEQGCAIQWMRSWFTPMPGEIVSCVGCHEDQNMLPVPKRVLASEESPRVLTPPAEGIHPFNFPMDIQPILDRACIACHDGKNGLMTLKGDESETYRRGVVTKIVREYSKSYLNLHPYVYRQGPEADIYVLRPYEYHASNSELIRMLDKGHHGVALTDAERQTLCKWIDFNAPYSGSFEIWNRDGVDQYDRRRELMRKYAHIDVDWRQELENYAATLKAKGTPVSVLPERQTVKMPDSAKVRKWCFDAETARNMQAAGETVRIVEVAPGVSMRLVWVPAGKFRMGEDEGAYPLRAFRKTNVKKGFWMGETEVTNEQFRALFPEHDSRYIGQQWKDHTSPGYPANQPLQPVVRVSWEEAMEFCRALGERTGLAVSLPTEEQWEWACRAGSGEDMWYGDVAADYSEYENMADRQIRDLAVMGVDPRPMPANYPLRKFWDFVPRDTLADDKNLLSVAGGQYRCNPWGLYDMHGNVAEWTSSDRPGNTGEKIVRGGSWRDRARTSTASYRKYYRPWQAPFNVGFRIVVE